MDRICDTCLMSYEYGGIANADIKICNCEESQFFAMTVPKKFGCEMYRPCSEYPFMEVIR